MTPPDPVALALILARILERLGVRYCIGGSVASSVYGEVRTTLDVDVVADLHTEDVDAFVAALGSDFHVVEEAVRRAVRDHSSFNLIHEEMLVKADVYVPLDDPAHRVQFERTRRVALRSEPGSEVALASPEDVVVHKLRGYEMGGRISGPAVARRFGRVEGAGRESGLTLSGTRRLRSGSRRSVGPGVVGGGSCWWIARTRVRFPPPPPFDSRLRRSFMARHSNRGTESASNGSSQPPRWNPFMYHIYILPRGTATSP